MYRVLLESRAEKDLESLDKIVQKRAVERLLLLQTNPRPAGSKRLVGSHNAWRVRIGDWRIIYEINDRTETVKVYRIKHRSKAYG
ncbi:MAG: type II toxin-antitoxin system RelE/ParE family toxin [Patescibacteria group bacterium]